MKLVRKSILPIMGFIMIVLLGRCIYMVNGQVDLFRLCMVFGIPFGIPYMFLMVPIGGDISKGIGILALDVIVGALIGFVIAAISFCKALFYLLGVFGRVLFRETGRRISN